MSGSSLGDPLRDSPLSADGFLLDRRCEDPRAVSSSCSVSVPREARVARSRARTASAATGAGRGPARASAGERAAAEDGEPPVLSAPPRRRASQSRATTSSFANPKPLPRTHPIDQMRPTLSVPFKVVGREDGACARRELLPNSTPLEGANRRGGWANDQLWARDRRSHRSFGRRWLALPSRNRSPTPAITAVGREHA